MGPGRYAGDNRRLGSGASAGPAAAGKLRTFYR